MFQGSLCPQTTKTDSEIVIQLLQCCNQSYGSGTCSNFPFLNHILIPETCLGSTYSLDVFSRLVTPPQASKTESKIIIQAAGKGVILPSSKEQAHAGLKDIMLAKEFGSAGDEVVIEEFLQGDEISILSFSDGYTIKSLPCGVRTFRSKRFLFGSKVGVHAILWEQIAAVVSRKLHHLWETLCQGYDRKFVLSKTVSFSRNFFEKDQG